MEMSQIRYFRALVEELNFTRAAERCQVSQPALTRSIRLLEQEFGGALFNRERNETHLSELGRIVQPHIDEIYEQARLATQGARHFAILEQAQLKLGVMCTVAPKDLIQLIAGVRMRHPGIQVDFVNATAPELDEALRSGELELAILCKAEDDHDDAFHYQPLFREQFVIATAPIIRLRAGTSSVFPTSGKKPYLRRINCEFGEIAGRVFRANGCIVQTVYKSDRDDWILAMAAAGMGFSFLPQILCRPPGCRRSPPGRSGVLARGQSGYGPRTPAFACRRRAGSRSNAGHLERRGRPLG